MRDPGGARGDQLAAALRAPGEVPQSAAQPPSGPYEDWTVAELRARAAEAGVVGRARMRKADLVRELRSR